MMKRRDDTIGRTFKNDVMPVKTGISLHTAAVPEETSFSIPANVASRPRKPACRGLPPVGLVEIPASAGMTPQGTPLKSTSCR
jgi:hypothetical protein